MNEMRVFENKEFGSVRTIAINGEPWFVGKDVAFSLGYRDTVSAIQDHIDGDDKRVWQIATTGGRQNMTIINESGLYSLIFGSRLESSKKFKKWVTSEVLPEIRKTGNYISEKKPDSYTIETRLNVQEDGLRNMKRGSLLKKKLKRWSRKHTYMIKS